jgi:hypothetical protein
MTLGALALIAVEGVLLAGNAADRSAAALQTLVNVLAVAFAAAGGVFGRGKFRRGIPQSV